MHVTKGVHGEIQNVRYQRWKQKPNLLNHQTIADNMKSQMTKFVVSVRRLVNVHRHKMSTFH